MVITGEFLTSATSSEVTEEEEQSVFMGQLRALTADSAASLVPGWANLSSSARGSRQGHAGGFDGHMSCSLEVFSFGDYPCFTLFCSLVCLGV